MENKVHFKLHKVKKQWVTIAVSGLAVGASLIGVGVSADEEAANHKLCPPKELRTVSTEIPSSSAIR